MSIGLSADPEIHYLNIRSFYTEHWHEDFSCCFDILIVLIPPPHSLARGDTGNDLTLRNILISFCVALIHSFCFRQFVY